MSRTNEFEIENEESEDVSEIYEENEYGNAIEVFSVSAKSARAATVTDSRIPSNVNKPSGTVSHFGQTTGGVSLSIVPTATTIQNKYKFQGTAKANLIFTGDILGAKATISVVESYTDNGFTLSSTGSQVGTLREFLIKAANEKIDDINGIKGKNGFPNITDRTHLVLALSEVLSANNMESNTTPPLKLTFRDLDSITPKQITLDFVASTIFNTDIDLIKNVVNENSFVDNQSKAATARNYTMNRININPEGIAVNVNFKSQKAENGLKTNTNYEFIAPNKDLVFYTEKKVGNSAPTSSVRYLEGLNLTSFKTGKQLPIFETLSVVGNTLNVSSMIALAEVSSTTNAVSNIDFNSIDNTTFLDYDNMISQAAANVALKVNGTNIKFNTLKIYDVDSTITKVEIEDDRKERYPVALVPVESENTSKGYNPQVNGLQRSTPYIFRKMYITAKPENSLITKQLIFAKFDSSSSTITAQTMHNLSVRTSSFFEPTLTVPKEENTYANSTTGVIGYENTGTAISVVVPKYEVTLPNKIKLSAVKNDKTALRYVVEVDKSEVTIKNLSINGLNGLERSKIEKIEGKDKVYFIVTLTGLAEKRDYGFLIFELTYVDNDGKELITRQVLAALNPIKQVVLTGQASKPIKQYPDETQDNTTGPGLSVSNKFNVRLFDAITIEPRKAEIPVFIDDINGRFVRIDFKTPEGNEDVKLELDGNILKFTNLEPNKEVVYKIDFIWKNDSGKEQVVSKYAKIATPQVFPVDVRSTTITTTSTTAEIAFNLYSPPKSAITGITLGDSKIKYLWNTATPLILKLENLVPNTEYKNIEVTFRLQNGLITKYKVEAFRTKEIVAPPTGKIADFVSRIYIASLGRQPEIEGWKFWVQKLESRQLPVSQFIYGIMKEDEFVNRFLSKEDFVKAMYEIVVGRTPDKDGARYWEKKYDEYRLQENSLADLRIRIANEMMNESEFKQYVTSLGLKY